MSFKKLFGLDDSPKETVHRIVLEQDQEYMELLEETARELRMNRVYLSCILAIAMLILIYLLKNRNNG